MKGCECSAATLIHTNEPAVRSSGWWYPASLNMLIAGQVCSVSADDNAALHKGLPGKIRYWVSVKLKFSLFVLRQIPSDVQSKLFISQSVGSYKPNMHVFGRREEAKLHPERPRQGFKPGTFLLWGDNASLNYKKGKNMNVWSMRGRPRPIWM